jgi:hypothetical protein
MLRHSHFGIACLALFVVSMTAGLAKTAALQTPGEAAAAAASPELVGALSKMSAGFLAGALK